MMKADVCNKEIAEFVKEQRTAQRYSLRQLAAAADVSLRSLVTIENGEAIRDTTVSKVLECLGFEFELKATIDFKEKKKK